MTDWDLLQQHLGGSPHAMGQLVARHMDWVYSMALRQVRDPHVAEDVAQAAFIVLMEKAGKIKKDRSIAAWLFHVVRYVSATSKRSTARRKHYETHFASMNHPIDEPGDLDNQWEQIAPVIDQVISRLRQKSRESLIMRFYQQKSFAEIAEATGVNELAARKRVERALEKVRELLKDRGVAITSAILGAALLANVTHAASAALISSTTAALTSLATGARVGGGASIMLAHQAVAGLAWKTIITATVAGSMVVGGAAIVGGQYLKARAAADQHKTFVSGTAIYSGIALLGTVHAASDGPSAPGDVVAQPAENTPDQLNQPPATKPTPHPPAVAPTAAGKMAISAWDQSMKAMPYVKGWPLALPGEITGTPVVADLNGDGNLAIVVPCRQRNAQQAIVHPEPNWATQLFAFYSDGTMVKGYPIELVPPIETPNPKGFWCSSPSVYQSVDGKANFVLTLPLGKGTAIVHADGTVKSINGGNASVNPPLVDIDHDGKIDLIYSEVLQNVEGGPIAGWPGEKGLGALSDCIGDADGDGELEVYHLSFRTLENDTLAEVCGFDHNGNVIDGWGKNIDMPNFFPPVMGDVTGDSQKEIIAAYGTHLFVWTSHGEGVPGTVTDGPLTGIFKDKISAWQASPALADLDGDGKAEIILFDQATKTLRAWHGDGTGVSNPDGIIAHIPMDCAGVSVADLGNDGVIDFFTGTYWVKWNRATNQSEVINMLPGDAAINFVQPTIADINGDGKAEVIFGLRDGRLFVYQTGLTAPASVMQWPTANGNFQHTGVWNPPAKK